MRIVTVSVMSLPLCMRSAMSSTKTTFKFTLCHFTEKLDAEHLFCFDSSTITLFVDMFKGWGRNILHGKKKGGLKLHTKLLMMGLVPDLVHLTEAACNDKTFLGQTAGSTQRNHLPL
ncbi:MAG: hypothetical protein AAF600_10080 [Bacteroidota bacterium]